MSAAPCSIPGCTYCTPDKRVRNAEGHWRCQGCDTWYPTYYLCSNERTHRLECRGCYLCWFRHEQHEEPGPAVCHDCKRPESPALRISGVVNGIGTCEDCSAGMRGDH